MSQQFTFADSEFSSKRHQTRKEIFLSRMDNLLPWPQLLKVIEPFYPKTGNGRRPYPLETMSPFADLLLLSKLNWITFFRQLFRFLKNTY